MPEINWQSGELQDALVSAFPTEDSLRQMVQRGLNTSLATIVGNGNLEGKVFDLIQWASSRGEGKALLTAALEANPGNYRLRTFAEGQYACFWIENKLILIDPTAHSSFSSISDEIFLARLQDRVPAFTYGAKWIIVSKRFRHHVLAAVEWVTASSLPIREVVPNWSRSVSPRNLMINRGSEWNVLLKDMHLSFWPEAIYGVVTNDSKIIELLINDPKAIGNLYEKKLKVCSPPFDKYEYRCVFDNWLNINGLSGSILRG